MRGRKEERRQEREVRWREGRKNGGKERREEGMEGQEKGVKEGGKNKG